MVTTQQTMVTGKINGQDVTVPAGTYILEAARLAGIEVPNLCYQPLLRPWGSCRICTVEVLGRRGGLIESCATPIAEGMEVLTHSPEALQARQYILQMYLIDHALDCPTCDKSGECYLQDNTYLHNINANPYRRPKLAQPYEHFSATIDYKWDRCIMCSRCTRVCDEVVGVVAIEAANRALEATISVAFGKDLSETSCTNCGMCIAVCPVGAMTDRHFGHHPWELDTTETICGHCDVGCTLNIESNKGIVRRTTHLWERGVNHGYTCEQGRWGHQDIQAPDRLHYPRLTDTDGTQLEVSWPEAVDAVAEGLAHYQGSAFGALTSGENTNEETYVLQQFSRAVMQSNTVERLMTEEQSAVERATRTALGLSVSGTNNMQELFTAARNILVVGPSIFKHAPIASYWINHARHYREARIVVVSTEHYLLCDRAALWLQPREGTTDLLLDAISAEMLHLGLNGAMAQSIPGFDLWKEHIQSIDIDDVAEKTGVPAPDIRKAAVLIAAGRETKRSVDLDSELPPTAVFHTLAHLAETEDPSSYGDVERVSTACSNLGALAGSLGDAGGGIASFRGPANFQGATDMGATSDLFPGAAPLQASDASAILSQTWLSRWGEKATTSNGFVPVRSLPDEAGFSFDEIVDAIERGDIRAMWIEGGLATRQGMLNTRLFEALKQLEFLVVADTYDSPLSRIAHVVLPLAMNLEKDGTFTSYDRTVQRLRASVPAIGEARTVIEMLSDIAQRMGYAMHYSHPAEVMSEISRVVPGYGGVTYARLERGGIVTPAAQINDVSGTILHEGLQGQHTTIRPRYVSAAGSSA